MSEILLFHHALGPTPGVLALANTIRQAGHQVHIPDLYQGRLFTNLNEGVDHARTIGFDVLLERAKALAQPLSTLVVYAGISLGVMPAQMLAQTRHGAAGALLLEACVPVSEFSDHWPTGVPVQIHGMDHDPIFAGDGDLKNACDLIAAIPGAELFLYPGDKHLFSDNSLPSYNEQYAKLLMARMLSFLDGLQQLPA